MKHCVMLLSLRFSPSFLQTSRACRLLHAHCTRIGLCREYHHGSTVGDGRPIPDFLSAKSNVICCARDRHHRPNFSRTLFSRRLSTVMSQSGRTELFPEIEPYHCGKLKVSDIHEIYYEECGNKEGKPVVFLHGGPGGGITLRDRRYYDPAVFRIVLFDQRGAGKSTPAAEIKENTTWDAVEDIEKLRKHLGIDKWMVFGGSWGSTLALAYAETHPDKVKALVLRGIFMLRRRELLWFYQEGASFLFPDVWEKYLEPIPVVERGDLMGAYYRRLTSDDEAVRVKAAKAWSTWEMSTSRLIFDKDMLKRVDGDIWAQQFARIESHFFVHGGWFKSESHLLDDVDKIRHIPTTIVHGRYDVVCPMENAWLLHKRFPEADFHIVPDAGHSNREAGTAALLLQAVEKYKDL